jgi:5-formyltetrahydrofolate cyclo-ligase
LDRVRVEHAWTAARTILAFHPLPEEVDVGPLLEEALAAGRGVWLPRVAGDHLTFHRITELSSVTERHALGMSEPPSSLPAFDAALASRPILVLTPGLAFDRRGARLGRGRGYYDRFLHSLRGMAGGACHALAVGYDEQLIEHVPFDATDEAVDTIVTDRETVRPRP